MIESCLPQINLGNAIRKGLELRKKNAHNIVRLEKTHGLFGESWFTLKTLDSLWRCGLFFMLTQDIGELIEE